MPHLLPELSHRHLERTLPVVRAEAAYALACLGRLRSPLDGRWFVSLRRVILAASHWLSVPPANGESGAPSIQCLGAPLAQTTDAGSRVDSELFYGLAIGTRCRHPPMVRVGHFPSLSSRLVPHLLPELSQSALCLWSERGTLYLVLDCPARSHNGRCSDIRR